MHTAIRDWPARERPREKLLELGPGALSDAELLAIIIGSGYRGRSAVDVGRDLIKSFGSLREFLTATPKQCLRQRSIGPACLAKLRAALELARRHHLDALRTGPGLNGTQSTNVFLQAQLRDKPYEVFCCLYLDVRYRLIAFEELFRGTIDSATVHIREVVRQALAHNAASVIFAHNHPSGVAEPSSADEHVTRQLKESLALVNVKVLDHIIVGDCRCTSFTERGLL